MSGSAAATARNRCTSPAGRRPISSCLPFPTSTTTLIGRRAQATIDVLRALIVELAQFEVVAVVKLGYPTASDGKEHLSFTAHSIGASTIDATLEIARSRSTCSPAGERSAPSST